MQSDAAAQSTNTGNVIYLSDIRKSLGNDKPPGSGSGAAAARQYELEFVQAMAAARRYRRA
jgi:hypothetical protein